VKETLLILRQFHVELRFLGTIGTLIEGSGLSEALEQIIAKNSVPQVMNGKNMERAFRAHMTTATALNKIILNKILTLNKATEETEALNELLIGEPGDLSNEVDEPESDSSRGTSDDESEDEDIIESIYSSTVPSTSFGITNVVINEESDEVTNEEYNEVINDDAVMSCPPTPEEKERASLSKQVFQSILSVSHLNKFQKFCLMCSIVFLFLF
jgi:hypothetical protein